MSKEQTSEPKNHEALNIGGVRHSALLDDEKLTVAFHILFDKDWKKYWTKRDKAREMRSIFNGGTQLCRPFENWVKCIEYLLLHCA